MAVNPRGADLKRYLAEDPGGPVVMLNLLRWRADDPEAGKASYREYVAAFEEHSGRFGAEVVYAGTGLTALVAEQGQDWDAVLLVRYPSRQSFCDMVADPDYQRSTHLRTEALEEAVLQATTEW
ncbi:MAG: hypothetical protein CMH83_17740 [Nocardioides sp.]|nr:hypothetical protein [Nocardioides sp.]